jgi:hypothetical protein
MLKRLIINQKTVPVPIPIKTLADACAWIDEVLVPVGETVTSAMLDEKDVLELWSSTRAGSAITLHPESRLEIRIESPEDLALQSYDAIHSLAGAILRNIKVIAVQLWQSKHTELQPELLALREDIGLICDLIERLDDIGISDKIDLAMIKTLQDRIHKIAICLDAAGSIGDWRASAQILLRDTSTAIGLETTLKQLVDESESSHLRLLTSRTMKSFGARVESK